MTQKVSIKLAFRPDEGEGIVRCFLSSLDDKSQLELARTNLQVLRLCPGAFEDWKALMERVFAKLLADEGFQVSGFKTFHTGDKN